jgi:hypothetical protein
MVVLRGWRLTSLRWGSLSAFTAQSSTPQALVDHARPCEGMATATAIAVAMTVAAAILTNELAFT